MEDLGGLIDLLNVSQVEVCSYLNVDLVDGGYFLYGILFRRVDVGLYGFLSVPKKTVQLLSNSICYVFILFLLFIILWTLLCFLFFSLLTLLLLFTLNLWNRLLDFAIT